MQMAGTNSATTEIAGEEMLVKTALAAVLL